MDEVTSGLFRIPFGFILFLMLITGIIGMLIKSTKKKFMVTLIIIQLVLAYTMYFSGYYRRAPLTEKNVQEIIEITPSDFSPSFFQGNVKNKNSMIYYYGQIWHGNVKDLERGRFFEELFTRRGTLNDRPYCMLPVQSDKGDNWQIAWHTGYIGIIQIQLDDEHYLELEYNISRDIDYYLGFFYAPPLLPIYSFTA